MARTVIVYPARARFPIIHAAGQYPGFAGFPGSWTCEDTHQYLLTNALAPPRPRAEVTLISTIPPCGTHASTSQQKKVNTPPKPTFTFPHPRIHADRPMGRCGSVVTIGEEAQQDSTSVEQTPSRGAAAAAYETGFLPSGRTDSRK